MSRKGLNMGVFVEKYWRCGSGSNRRIRVLQTLVQAASTACQSAFSCLNRVKFAGFLPPLFFLAASLPAPAADWTRLRHYAQLAGCAASGLDAFSTIRPGLQETNPVLGGNSVQIIGIKAGVCALQVGLAEWQHHRYPAANRVGADKVATFAGFGTAAAYSAFAWHNFRQGGAK